MEKEYIVSLIWMVKGEISINAKNKLEAEEIICRDLNELILPEGQAIDISPSVLSISRK